MAYKTIEADKNGRVSIYPSLYAPKDKEICKFFRSLLRRFASPRRR